MKYSQILRENSRLRKKTQDDPITISVLANVMIPYLPPILEWTLRKKSLNAHVVLGDYDNIVQESERRNRSDVVVIFWEAANLAEGLYYRLSAMAGHMRSALKKRMEKEIDLVLKNLEKTALVLFNRFSASPFERHSLQRTPFSELVDGFNCYVSEHISNHVRLIDLERIFMSVSLIRSVQLRDFYSSKALYTVDFFRAYAEEIKPYILASRGKSKKALIFDCDNTLWRGILGEDGFENIDMSPHTPEGKPFAEVQHLAKELGLRGVIIGLCSKNNPEDIEQVFQKHPDFILKDDIVIKMVNWEDKASNLRRIAASLNIGLDSIVIVDDSDFEINLIKNRLPEVEVVQVPKMIHRYPETIRLASRLFFQLSQTKEDVQKAEMYKTQARREEEKQKFSDLADYLKSLQMDIEVHVNDSTLLPRMSQLTQKTNQFNLTTKRYTESDIRSIIANGSANVYAIHVRDRFGESGLTGLSIAKKIDNSLAEIDTFLLSCRIIGRNIEYRFLDFILQDLRKNGINQVKACYLETAKNAQVKGFYEKSGFAAIRHNRGGTEYLLYIENYRVPELNYIDIHRV